MNKSLDAVLYKQARLKKDKFKLSADQVTGKVFTDFIFFDQEGKRKRKMVFVLPMINMSIAAGFRAIWS